MFNDTFSDSQPFPDPRIFHAAGRGRGPFGFGAGGFGRGFMGGGIPAGRKFSSSDLQLVLLALLEERPTHGYELIRALEEKSNGFYVPSPGVIYPALTYLDEIGHAAVEQDGNRKLYRLTDEGRRYLDANRATAEAMLDVLSRIGGRMERVREAFAGWDELDPRAAGELHRAMHGLKHAVMRTRELGPDKARLIAGIPERATAGVITVSKPAAQKPASQTNDTRS